MEYNGLISLMLVIPDGEIGVLYNKTICYDYETNSYYRSESFLEATRRLTIYADECMQNEMNLVDNNFVTISSNTLYIDSRTGLYNSVNNAISMYYGFQYIVVVNSDSSNLNYQAYLSFCNTDGIAEMQKESQIYSEVFNVSVVSYCWSNNNYTMANQCIYDNIISNNFLTTNEELNHDLYYDITTTALKTGISFSFKGKNGIVFGIVDAVIGVVNRKEINEDIKFVFNSISDIEKFTNEANAIGVYGSIQSITNDMPDNEQTENNISNAIYIRNPYFDTCDLSIRTFVYNSYNTDYTKEITIEELEYSFLSQDDRSLISNYSYWFNRDGGNNYINFYYDELNRTISNLREIYPNQYIPNLDDMNYLQIQEMISATEMNDGELIININNISMEVFS